MATEEAKKLSPNPTARALLEYSPEQLELFPVEPTTGIPLLPRAQPGYYPGFSTLSQQKFWDEVTRTVVLARVQNVPPLRFFSTEDAALMQAVIDRVLPQDDRDEEHKIPILPYIDERLYTKRIDGYRYAKMPPEDEAMRLGLQAIDAIARHLHDKPFVELGPRQQDEVLKTIHDGHPPAAEQIWQRMPVKRFWAVLVQNVVHVYYAHPYAWDEIGFGGPAYPRGYMRQERGEPEPWEVDENRYVWAPPPSALSVGDTSYGWAPPHPGDEHPGGGEGGTH